MQVLIFGCGYLGQRVASAWLKAGHEVFAVTRSEQKAELLRLAGIQPIVADLCERQSLDNLPVVDVVLHSVGFDRNSARTHEDVTCGGMRNVLDAVTGRCSRFIDISSTSVYGQSSGECVDETSVCQPTQPGGMLCLQAEQLVQDWASRGQGRSANILRLAGIYGPGRLLSRIDALKSGLVLTGRGDAMLNLIHVDDAVTAITACEKYQIENQTYLVVDDQPVQRATYFELLASLVDAPSPRFDPEQPRTRGSGGLNKRCSNRKIRQSLNWVPVYSSIETGLPSAIDD